MVRPIDDVPAEDIERACAVAHKTRVNASKRGFQPACSCGWKGPRYDGQPYTMTRLKMAAEADERAMQHKWFPWEDLN